MIDLGHNDHETLYDFAVSLSLVPYSCLDPKSDIYKAFKEVLDSVWGQLPKTIFIDLRDPDTIPTPRPPVTLIWDEENQRYI